MKPASASSSDTPLEQKRQTFRDLTAESEPLTKRLHEIGVEQFGLAFEINLEIAVRAFPRAKVTAVNELTREMIPKDCVLSPHDIPRSQTAAKDPRWILSVLIPTDDGRAAETICEYLKLASTEPSEIMAHKGAFRVLLVR